MILERKRLFLFSNLPANNLNLPGFDGDFYSEILKLVQHLPKQDQDNPVIPKNILGEQQNQIIQYINLSAKNENPLVDYLKQTEFDEIVQKTHDGSLDLHKIVYEIGLDKFLKILDEKSIYLQDVINEDLLDFRIYDASKLDEISQSDYFETLLQYPHIIKQLFLRNDIPEIHDMITYYWRLDRLLPTRLRNGEDCMPFLPLGLESFYYYAGKYVGDGFETEISSQEYNDILSSFLIKDDNYKHNNDKLGYFSQLYRLDLEYLGDLRSGVYEYREANPDAKKEAWRMPMAERTKVLSDILKTVKTNGKIILYRGLDNFRSLRSMTDGPLTTLDDNNIRSLIGKELFDRSFTSYSIQEGIAQYYSQTFNGEPNKMGLSTPIIKLTIPEEKSINAIPIGNANEEVVLNRYQKLKVQSIDRIENGEGYSFMYINCEVGDDNGKIEEQIYKTPQFKQYQAEFEVNLGKYLYKKEGCRKDGKAYNAVQYAINHIRNKYIKSSNAADIDRKTFYSNALYNNPYYPGSISWCGGNGLSDKEIDAVLSDDISTKKQLERNNRLVHGTFREKMLALISALDKPDEYSELCDDLIEPVIYVRERPKEEQEKLRRDLDYQDQMGLTRSQRERDYQSRTQLPDYKSPLVYNKMKYIPVIKTPKETPVDSLYGKRLVGGTSELAMNLLSEYRQHISPNEMQLLNFRLAIMAYMLPEENHSLYEILTGSHQAEVRGYENLSTADTMDKSIDPISEESLRDVPEVCRDRLFPYERAYKEYIKNNP